MSDVRNERIAERYSKTLQKYLGGYASTKGKLDLEQVTLAKSAKAIHQKTSSETLHPIRGFTWMKQPGPLPLDDENSFFGHSRNSCPAMSAGFPSW